MGKVNKADQKAVLPLHFRIGTFTTSCTTNNLQKPFGEIYIDEPVFARADLNDDNDFSDTDEQFYYLHNAQYSVHAIIDASGNIIEVYKNYQPYGAVDVYTGDGGDSDWFDGDETTGSLSGNYYLFTGRRYDPEADLMFYRNRMYSTSRGRFLQRDPIGYWAGLNLFAYVGCNPVRWLDPFGLQGNGTGFNDLHVDFLSDEAQWEYERTLVIVGPYTPPDIESNASSNISNLGIYRFLMIDFLQGLETQDKCCAENCHNRYRPILSAAESDLLNALNNYVQGGADADENVGLAGIALGLEAGSALAGAANAIRYMYAYYANSALLATHQTSWIAQMGMQNEYAHFVGEAAADSINNIASSSVPLVLGTGSSAWREALEGAGTVRNIYIQTISRIKRRIRNIRRRYRSCIEDCIIDEM